MIPLDKALHACADKKKASFLLRYFKTDKGEYGQGDVFLGITVPVQRSIARTYTHLSLAEIASFLKSKIHEVRFTALEILVMNYEKASLSEKKKIYDFYIKNTSSINNWDLVDTSAPYIVGGYLQDKNKDPLRKLARSKNLWERRIAIVATQPFIQSGEFKMTFELVRLLLKDTHDLIHKACGWMLREIGKRDKQALVIFLNEHYNRMPRTMLRYAIERFPQARRKAYLEGRI